MGCADELSAPWADGCGSDPETRRHRKPVATSLRVSTLSRELGGAVR